MAAPQEVAAQQAGSGKPQQSLARGRPNVSSSSTTEGVVSGGGVSSLRSLPSGSPTAERGGGAQTQVGVRQISMTTGGGMAASKAASLSPRHEALADGSQRKG